MSAIQVGFTLFFGVVIWRLVGAVRAGGVDWRRMRLWVALWTIGLVAVWDPGLATWFARVVGVGRGVDAVVYSSVAVLSYLVFRLYVVVEKQDQVVTRLVSELALAAPQSETDGTGRSDRDPGVRTSAHYR